MEFLACFKETLLNTLTRLRKIIPYLNSLQNKRKLSETEKIFREDILIYLCIKKISMSLLKKDSLESNLTSTGKNDKRLDYQNNIEVFRIEVGRRAS